MARLIEWLKRKLQYEEITGLRAEMVRAALEDAP
jgi:hypothetical protein